LDGTKIKKSLINFTILGTVVGILFLSIIFEDYSLEIPELEPISVIETEYTNFDPQNLLNHSKISIDGNNQFQQKAISEGWKGDGTQHNPYVIEYYRIIGLNGYDSSIGESLIELRNIDLFFVVNNCILYSGWYGIYFDNVRNGNIGNTLAFNNSMGFFITNSFSNYFVNNTVYKNRGVGFYLQYSERNTLIHNKASFNGKDGYEKPCNLYENTFEDNIDTNNNLTPDRYPIIFYIFGILLLVAFISLIIYLPYLATQQKSREKFKELMLYFRDVLSKKILFYLLIVSLLMISILFLNNELITGVLKRLICQ
jgi:parallel beta-helix repeat protein